MALGRSPRTLVALLAVAAGYAAELAILRSVAGPTESLRLSFALASAWNVLASAAWAARALRGGPEARGFWLGAAGLALLVLAGAGSTLSAGAPAGIVFSVGQAVAALLLAGGLLSFARRRSGLGRGVASLGAVVFTASAVLLLWILGSWEATRAPDPLLAGVQRGMALRQGLLSGVVAYLVLEVPGRIRGLLGWAAGSVAAGAVTMMAFQRLITEGVPFPTPVAALVALIPLLLAAGAWSGAPAEVDTTRPPPDQRWALLVFAPFVVAAGVLATGQLREQDHLSLPTLGFIVIAVGVVAVAGVLLHELARGRQELEARVLDRTAQLEEAMVALVRNRRLSVVAALGAGATHDLKNLLGVVRNHAFVIREELAAGEPAGAGESVDDLVEATERAASLVGRILDYLREDVEPPGPVDLGAAVGGEERVLRAVVPRSIDLRLQLPREPALILGSVRRVQQILLNLLANACAALGTRGRIEVRVVGGGAQGWSLEVQDDGPGLPRDILTHLFEPLRTTRSGQGGTGLGLASVKALAELDGGMVAVRSAPGDGTAVIVNYPAVPGPGAAPRG